MKKQEFWSLIEAAHQRSEGNVKRQCRLLMRVLAVLGADKIEEFWEVFSELCSLVDDCRHSPKSPLSELNGLTDTTWSHFQMWLVAQGEATYHRALGASHWSEIVPEIMAIGEGRTSCENFFDLSSDAYFVWTLTRYEDWEGFKKLPD